MSADTYVVIYKNLYAGPAEVEVFHSLEAAEGFTAQKVEDRQDTPVLLCKVIEQHGDLENL